MKKSGFTLLDMLLVITVLSLVLAVGLPRIIRSGFLDQYRVYLATHEVASAMRLARRLSVESRVAHRVYMPTDTNLTYEVQRFEGPDAEDWVKVGDTKTLYSKIVLSRPDGENVAFGSDGRADCTCSYEFTLNTQVSRIDITYSTGRAELFIE